jgi:hypothetical protein
MILKTTQIRVIIGVKLSEIELANRVAAGELQMELPVFSNTVQ